MNRNVMLAGLAVVAVAVGGFFMMNRGASPELPGVASPAQAQTAGDIDTSIVQEMALGDENAPITMVEYASYTCPHCRTFHKDVFPQLKADYIDTGKVRFIYREVYFDGPGLWAGMCLQDGDKARALTAVFQENAERDGIRSTPSFMIDGKLESNMSYADLQALLDAKL